MPEKKHFSTGLQVYSVFKRSLEDGYGKMRSLQNFLLLSYGIFDWLCLDLKGGAGNIKNRLPQGTEIKYPPYLGGGYGFRVRLYNGEKAKMIFGFQHISVHPYTASIDGSKHKAVLDDWQFSFLLSRQFSKMTPYIGTRWSRMDNIHWIDTVRKLEKSDLHKSAGLIVGTDIPLTKKTWFNVEGQFFDATAVTGSLNFRF
ncbi:MAG TPA: hypothetical protein VMD52_00480 [Patescibacteria group bacterium]|nr:hypothetical protein [Patescibacteria group bacterium]